MRKGIAVLILGCSALFLSGRAQAQQVDAAFGLGGLKSPSASSASGNHNPATEGGGLYAAISGDFLFKNHLGVEGDVAWRASRGTYFGSLPFRPILYSFNGIWAPPLGSSRAALELLGGIGGEDIRFYQNQFSCTFIGCTNFVGSKHFLADVGGGLKLYPWHHIFIRPEVRQYFIRNNFEFSSDLATRYSISIGYTLGAQ